jgi:Leucine-rich repeat (LRR) protein
VALLSSACGRDGDIESEPIIEVASVEPTLPEANIEPTAPEPIVDYIIIRGERYSTALTSLDLAWRGLSNEDIVPLRYMTDLTWLDLRANQISDISPLSSLTNLTRLFIRSNRISDLIPLGWVDLSFIGRRALT